MHSLSRAVCNNQLIDPADAATNKAVRLMRIFMEEFLRYRPTQLLDLIEATTGKQIVRLDSDETIRPARRREPARLLHACFHSRRAFGGTRLAIASGCPAAVSSRLKPFE